uniref:Kinetoplast polyadenylation/uridylation factor 2 n=1 Tax=Leishmania guyanensis TaxID=5670 RepID=A0A1E1J5P7_LEIGU|nr:hypothetical protein, conserved [Leishmania guyanensis]
MPLLKSFNRCLPGFSVGSSAYTNIYRWCSSPSQSPIPEQTQQTQAHPSPITNSGLGVSHPAASLDLGLNFATMDFEAVARATQSAIARERSASHLSQQRLEKLEARLEKQVNTSAAPQHAKPAPAPPLALSSDGIPCEPAPASHSASSPQSRRDNHSPVPGQQLPPSPTQRSHHFFGRDGSATRYSLLDMLKDCVADGQGVRALQLFTNAVDQACRQVLVPDGSAKSVAAVTASDSGSVASSTTPELECFGAMRKMLASLPPRQPRDRAVHLTRAANVKNMRGIMRWTGQHYYLLWKCLLEAGHVEELLRVWSVMQHIGFVEYQLEERTANALMALLRRTAQPTEVMIATVVSPDISVAEATSHQKDIRRELMKGLAQAAAARKFNLTDVNRRVAEGIRIAEALRRTEQGCDGRHTSADPGAAHDDDDGANATLVTDTDEAAVVVGDFNGLLRRARTFEGTNRVLHMMAKLNIEKEAITYASLIAALHNPQYVLPGHTAEELAGHQTGGATSPQPTGIEESGGTVKDVSTSGYPSTSVDPSRTKTSYEAYKEERIKAGMAWFAACPETQRTADVFNELLYLLRAKSHWLQFDTALTQLRGNAVVTETEWPEILRSAETHTPRSVSTITEVSSVSGPILPPRWSTWPNGKTYELLIHRARYVHQWEVMWALYEEMIASDVRGTPRVYEVLLVEARSHPPQSVLAAEGSGDTDASSRFLLRLYEELRRNGGDVHSLKGTLNVVNAWSKARTKSNRWGS